MHQDIFLRNEAAKADEKGFLYVTENEPDYYHKKKYIE
jgi:hypothetical protein